MQPKQKVVKNKSVKTKKWSKLNVLTSGQNNKWSKLGGKIEMVKTKMAKLNSDQIENW